MFENNQTTKWQYFVFVCTSFSQNASLLPVCCSLRERGPTNYCQKKRKENDNSYDDNNEIKIQSGYAERTNSRERIVSFCRKKPAFFYFLDNNRIGNVKNLKLSKPRKRKKKTEVSCQLTSDLKFTVENYAFGKEKLNLKTPLV